MSATKICKQTSYYLKAKKDSKRGRALVGRYFQGIPESGSEPEQRGGCAC